MEPQHPWKYSVIDVYANNYGNVVQDYLSLVVKPSLQALQQRSDELMATPDGDMITKAFLIGDHSLLQQKTAMAFCLGIQSLWEQQIRTYVANCVRQHFTPDCDPSEAGNEITKRVEQVQKATWGKNFNKLFLLERGLKLTSFNSYAQLDLLMRLGNVCRHGEGPEATRLFDQRPDLWDASKMAGNFLIGDDMEFDLDRKVADMKISFELLRSLVISVVLFWRDLERHGLRSFKSSDTPEMTIENLLSNRVRV